MRTPGSGRKPGSSNKLTQAAREAFALAFEGIGGVKKMTEWARKNPTDFYKLYARLIPVEIAAQVQHTHTAQDCTDDELASIARGGSRGVALPPARAQSIN